MTATNFIYILEENPVFTASLINALNSLGYENSKHFLSEESLVEEHEKHQLETNSIIFIDIEVSNEIRRIDLVKRLKTNLLIAVIYTSETIIEQALATSPSSFILKPYIIDQLTISIQLAMAKLKCENKIERQNQKLKQVNYELQKKVNDQFLKMDTQTEVLYKVVLQKKAKQEEQEKIAEKYRNQLELILDKTDTGIWEWDLRTGKITYNKAWQEFLGYKENEFDFNADWWRDNVSKEIFQTHEIQFENYKIGKSRYYEIEHELKKKDGTVAWVQTTGIASEKDGAGQILKMAGVKRDITLSKQQQQQILKREQRYRNIFQLAHVGIAHVNKNYIVTECNQAVSTIFSIPIDKLFGYDCKRLPNKEMVESIKLAMTNGDSEFSGWYHSPQNNQDLYLRANMKGLRNEHNEITEGVIIIQNLTSDILQKEELEKKELLFRTIVKNIPDTFVSLVDKDLIIKYSGRSDGEKNEVWDESVIGKHLTEIIRYDFDFFLQKYQQAFTGNTIEFEYNSKLDIIFQFSLIPIIRENVTQEVLVFARNTTTKVVQDKIKKLKLQMHYLAEKNDSKVVLKYAIEEIQSITRSKIGYIAYLDEENNENVWFKTWTDNTTKECKIAMDLKSIRIRHDKNWMQACDFKKTAIFNELVTKGEYNKEEDISLYREMIVPVFEDDKFVAFVAIANKETDYTENEIALVEDIAKTLWTIIRRIKAEDALKNSEQKYRSLFENMQMGVTILDKNFNIVEANPLAETIYKLPLSKSQIVDEKLGLSDFFDEQGISIPEDQLPTRLAMSTQKAIVNKIIGINYEQQTRWFSITAIPLVDFKTKEPVVYSIFEDITQQKKDGQELELHKNNLEKLVKIRTNEILLVNEELKKTTEKLLNLIASMPLAYIETNTDNQITEWNEWAKNIFEIDKNEIYNQKIDVLFDKISQKLNLLSHLEKNNTIFIKTHLINQKSKSLRWNIINLKNNNDEVTGKAYIIEDITLLKNAEIQLRDALKKEIELNELKTGFVSMTSHQFKTPLTTLLSNTELLGLLVNKLDVDDRTKAQRYIDRLLSNIERLEILLNDVLLIGRSQANKTPFKPEPFNFSDFVKSYITQTKFYNQGDRIVELSISGKERIIVADATLLSHVIQNLLSNAFKYSTKNPKFELDYGETQFKIIVSDEGIGIPAKDCPKIFQSFVRGSNTENIIGTGLGLVISKDYVEMHGGTIDFKSTENIGTSFIINLPYNSKKDQDEKNTHY